MKNSPDGRGRVLQADRIHEWLRVSPHFKQYLEIRDDAFWVGFSRAGVRRSWTFIRSFIHLLIHSIKHVGPTPAVTCQPLF